MSQNLVTNSKKIHFIGIGGIGVSALAKICHAMGIQVTGSDLTLNDQVEELKQANIAVSIGHLSSNITDQDLVVHSLAIPATNPELLQAKNQNIPILSYPQALGEITKNYTLIAVAGSHGKTTSTGMLAKILIDLDLDPTVIIGSTANFLQNQNFRLGKSKYFVLEACEYYAGFLNLHPDFTLITNLEHDHFDAYPTPESYLEAFQKLIEQTNQNVVLNTDFPLSKELTLTPKVLTFNQDDSQIELGIPGKHNQTNSNGVLKIVEQLGLSLELAKESLKTFTGTGRRLQIVKQTQNQKIYDDYGHHPTEIRATLQAIQEKHPNKSICLIYQAHQHNRTIALINEFKQAFSGFDKVLIPDIYAARDSQSEKETMSAQHFAEEIHATYTESLDNTGKNFANLTKGYDIVVIMGAGDIYSKLEPYL